MDFPNTPSIVLKCLFVKRIVVTERLPCLGAGALWALAGSTRVHQQRIASMIGINVLVDMLMEKSERLQFIAGMAMVALGTENIENQNKIMAGGGIQPLARLLRSGKASPKVSGSELD